MTRTTGRANRIAPKHLATLAAIAVLAIPASLMAQAQHGSGETHAQAPSQSLEERLNTLQEQVAILESALKRGHKSAPTSASAGSGGMTMGGMKAGEKNMVMGGKMMEGGMGMGMGDKMMKGGMGGMKMNPSASMASAQPGQPGRSHLLHVGSTGFFLDHPEHIELSREQQSRLNQISEAWQLKNADMQRGVDQAEQEVWTATAGADSAKIEAAVQKAEKLRSAQRLAFVRAVMDASTVLTQEQKDVLLGVAVKTN